MATRPLNLQVKKKVTPDMDGSQFTPAQIEALSQLADRYVAGRHALGWVVKTVLFLGALATVIGAVSHYFNRG